MSKSTTLDLFQFGAARRAGTSSVLGLCWDAGRVEAVWLKRTNGSITLVKQCGFTLSLDPLTNDPVLVGREIRNHLDQAHIRERTCVLALPLKWALTTHVAIPDIPQSDVPGFLDIEAERTFPCDPATLYTGISRYLAPDGTEHATLVGVPRAHVNAMDIVLRAAQLRPHSFTLGLPAQQSPDAPSSEGVMALAIGEAQVSLQLTVGKGVAALRTLEGTLESESGERSVKADLVVREVRITLGQLAPELRKSVRKIRIFGPRDLAQHLADVAELRLDSLDLEVEVPRTQSSAELGVHTPADAPITPAFSVAARHLARRPATFQFLPPRVTAWQQVARKYSSGRLQKAGIAAGVVLLAVAGVFGYQQWQLTQAQSQWAAMQSKVTELRDLQRRSAQFKPWADETPKGMMILRRLAEAFPEDGTVTAKLLEIRDPGSVVCSGVARDYQSLMNTVDRLRRTPEIPDVSLGQTRGNSPALQFTFGFVWTEGGRSAN